MPEGDSIYKVAARLRPPLVGKSLTRVELREHGPVPSLVGAVVERIEAHGKHMFVYVGDRRALHVHLGMKGRWRAIRGGASQRFSPRSAVVVLAVDADAYVCFDAAFARLRSVEQIRQVLGRLGPDVLGESFDPAAAAERAQSHARGTVASVLLDQRVAAGIGNVYKSEVLFLCGVHPQTAASAVAHDQWVEIFRCASELMRANLGPGRRSSTAVHKGARHPAGVERLWVYRRRDAPCLRCKTPIQRSTDGDHARSTYWCPRCQPTQPS